MVFCPILRDAKSEWPVLREAVGCRGKGQYLYEPAGQGAVDRKQEGVMARAVVVRPRSSPTVRIGRRPEYGAGPRHPEIQATRNVSLLSTVVSAASR